MGFYKKYLKYKKKYLDLKNCQKGKGDGDVIKECAKKCCRAVDPYIQKHCEVDFVQGRCCSTCDGDYHNSKHTDKCNKNNVMTEIDVYSFVKDNLGIKIFSLKIPVIIAKILKELDIQLNGKKIAIMVTGNKVKSHTELSHMLDNIANNLKALCPCRGKDVEITYYANYQFTKIPKDSLIVNVYNFIVQNGEKNSEKAKGKAKKIQEEIINNITNFKEYKKDARDIGTNFLSFLNDKNLKIEESVIGKIKTGIRNQIFPSEFFRYFAQFLLSDHYRPDTQIQTCTVCQRDICQRIYNYQLCVKSLWTTFKPGVGGIVIYKHATDAESPKILLGHEKGTYNICMGTIDEKKSYCVLKTLTEELREELKINISLHDFLKNFNSKFIMHNVIPYFYIKVAYSNIKDELNSLNKLFIEDIPKEAEYNEMAYLILPDVPDTIGQMIKAEGGNTKYYYQPDNSYYIIRTSENVPKYIKDKITMLNTVYSAIKYYLQSKDTIFCNTIDNKK